MTTARIHAAAGMVAAGKLASRGLEKKDIQLSCVSISDSKLDDKNIGSDATWRARVRAAVGLRWLCGAREGMCDGSLPEFDRNQIQVVEEADDVFVMGYNGGLTLVNGSPFDWTLNGQHSYQMDNWKWPTIGAGKATKVPVSFGTRGRTGDDAGEAYFDVARTSNSFSVLARNSSGHNLTIALNGMTTKQSPEGACIDLGFRQNATVNWILSTDDAGQWWSNSGTYTDWMQQSMGSLANRLLKHICMPGSHDAGMSVFRPGTVGAHFANTQTQYLDFYQQLVAGSRFFDLRPVISRGEWVAGHYGTAQNGKTTVWVGGNGLSIADIINQINDFTRQYNELIILNIGHTLDTDNKYNQLTQDQWNDLFDTLKGLVNRFEMVNPGWIDLTDRPLRDFITDRASVLLIAQLPQGITLGEYGNQGFFTTQNFPIYNSYTNTTDQALMKSDQFDKLREQRLVVSDPAQRKDRFHILSWTLTQHAKDVLNFNKAIMNMAANAFDDLVSEAWNEFTPEVFPNVLYVDALGIRDKCVVFPYRRVKTVNVNTDIAALAIAVNNGIAGRNQYVTGRKQF